MAGTSELSSGIHAILSRSGEYSDGNDDVDNDNDDNNDAYEDADLCSNVENVADDDDYWEVTKPGKRKQRVMSSDTKKKSRITPRRKLQMHTEQNMETGVADITQDGEDDGIERESLQPPVVYLRGKTVKLVSLNPFTIMQNINRTYGAVSKVERRGGSLKITCASLQQKRSILQSTELCDIEITPSLPNAEQRIRQEAIVQARYQRVVISGVPIDLNDSIIKSETAADEVRRITKRSPDSDDKVASKAVILGYNCSAEVIPGKVQIGYLSFKTRTYIPLVTRCYKCQKFGHVAAKCRKEANTCPVCAGPHSYAECESKDNKKCANCGGAHSVSYHDCPKFVVAKQVTHLAATERLSYRDALVKVKRKERQGATGEDASAVVADQPQQKHQPSSDAASTVVAAQINRINRTNVVNTGTQWDASDHATTTTTATTATNPTTTSTTTETAKAKEQESGTLSSREFYMLLVMIIKLSEDRANKSTMTKSIVDYVSSKLNHTTDEVYEKIYENSSSVSKKFVLQLCRTDQPNSAKVSAHHGY